MREYGVTPLSTEVNEEVVGLLRQKEIGTAIITDDKEKQLLAFSPIPITLGSEKFGFGGSQESIDHIKGNKGEGWHVVISLGEEEAIEVARETTRLIIVAGAIFTLLTAAFALLVGKRMTKPIVGLAVTVKTIGEGHLDARADVLSNDEIGFMAQSLNRMTENLQKTMASRDELINEVEQRKRVEEQIQNLLNEKEMLLKEVHHRIKNNMNVIRSLLSMQADKLETPEAVTTFQDAIARIESMGILYDKLYRTENYKAVSVKDYLSQLIDEIMQIFPGRQSTQIKKQIDNFNLDPKRLFPIGIIVNELLTNTMKYAFTGRNSDLLQITVKENHGNVILTIQDNGKGLPEGFAINKSGGFGLMLVDMLSQQLEGSFTIENNNGAKSTLEFCI